LIRAKNDDCGDTDCGEGSIGATVVAGMDVPRPEHVLDPVALFVDEGVMGDRDLPFSRRGEDQMIA
jgi:hypothetical protein